MTDCESVNLKNARLENDGQSFSKFRMELRACLENDGPLFAPHTSRKNSTRLVKLGVL